jgi:hypothetical protein
VVVICKKYKFGLFFSFDNLEDRFERELPLILYLVLFLQPEGVFGDN